MIKNFVENLMKNSYVGFLKKKKLCLNSLRISTREFLSTVLTKYITSIFQ